MMANFKSIFSSRKWLNMVLYINGIIVFCIISFFAGLRYSDCSIHKINDVHFINPDLDRSHRHIYEPTIIGAAENVLTDTLKKIKKPYSEGSLNNAIHYVAHKFYVDDYIKVDQYFKLLSFDSSSYKILVIGSIETKD